MNFYSVRDLRTDSKKMWSELSEGNEVVITNNGKPSALLVDIPEGAFEDILQAVRQAKAMIALNSMRFKAAKKGYLSEDEISTMIADVRSSN